VRNIILNRFSFLLAAGALAASAYPVAAVAAAAPLNRVTGFIVSVTGNTLVLQRRNGANLSVDLSEARAKSRVGVLAPRLPVELYGAYLANGAFHCVATGHAPPVVQSWLPDR
jgi:hypothetical protein